MPEMRRPGNSPRRQPGRPVRRPPPKPISIWVKVGLIVAPIILIALILNLTMHKKVQEEPVVVKVDPNARINELVKQVEILRKEYNTWRALMQKEDPSAKSSQEALHRRLDKWREEWDGIFEPKRDSDGNLPADLKGWGQYRSKVNELIEDVNKSSSI